jgi:cytochrome c biogenesis protein CcmG, thiol:disulfide interchange protein DsbE
MNRLAFLVPLVLFLLFAGVAGYMLTQPKDDTVKSAMIGRPLPAFDLPGETEDAPGLTSGYFVDGTPRLLNVWASWCVPCVAEAPQLEALQRAGAPIVGIAIRDTPEDIARFLARNGDPYIRIARDDISQVQLGIGSSGVPETFVIDGRGIIRYQHIGDIRPDDVPVLLRQLEQAR